MVIKPSSTVFDELWDELQSRLHEAKLDADERQHGGAVHKLFAILICRLLELITERLKSKHSDSTVDIPSQDWARLQLWPANAYTV